MRARLADRPRRELADGDAALSIVLSVVEDESPAVLGLG